MARRVVFSIPDEWEKEWQKLLELYGVGDEDLAWELVKDESAVIAGEKEKEAYERMETAAREVHTKLGSEYLDRFSREIELLAKKLVEELSM